MKLQGTISIDIDTPHSLYKGYNLGLSEDQQTKELEEGFSNIFDLMEEFNIKTTLFCVGNDMKVPKNQPSFKEAYLRGHEIANHTMSHSQGLRRLSLHQKEKEIGEFEEICQKVIGEKPRGFRAPGWNIDEEILKILAKRDYKYDSSVFPTFLIPILKCYWALKSRKTKEPRDAMGRIAYMFYPTQPYRTKRYVREGTGDLIEFPISVTPLLRMPFLTTFLFYYGEKLFLKMLSAIKKTNGFLNFMFHIHDFIDYENKRDYLKNIKSGYIPQSIKIRYSSKRQMYRRILSVMCKDYEFKTFQQHILRSLNI